MPAAIFFDSMRQATAHLLEFGRRRIAMTGDTEFVLTGRERLAGYLAAHASAGIKPHPA